MVRRGIDRLREGAIDRGVSVGLEPIFDAIYPLRDAEFLALVEQLAFVYAYQHVGTEDCFARLCARVGEGVRAARATLERDVGD